MLKIGHTGRPVRTLQALLNAHGATLALDGWYGPATAAAVRQFQQRAGLVIDGIAGPKTQAALQHNGQRPARLLGEAELVRAATELDIPLASIKALVEVESAGSGFLPELRPAQPVILFERHIMYRQLRAAGLDADALARAHPAVVSPTRGGYLGGPAEHRRLSQARQIHDSSAIESASWGLFQIMGFHWPRLGYDSAQQFEQRMRHSEGEQLGAFVRFIQAEPALHTALQARKWATVARLYNGPAYADNLYDTRLARAYTRHQRAAA